MQQQKVPLPWRDDDKSIRYYEAGVVAAPLLTGTAWKDLTRCQTGKLSGLFSRLEDSLKMMTMAASSKAGNRDRVFVSIEGDDW